MKILRDCITEYVERNKNNRDVEVYSVTNSNGFMPSTDYFSKEVFSKDLSSYKVVRRGMLAFNPSRINVGSVDCLQKKDEVIVSPLYIVVKVDEKFLLPNYLNLFLHSDIAIQQINALTSGSVRDSLKYKAFARLNLPIPTIQRQNEIISNVEQITKTFHLRRKQLLLCDQLAKSKLVHENILGVAA